MSARTIEGRMLKCFSRANRPVAEPHTRGSCTVGSVISTDDAVHSVLRTTHSRARPNNVQVQGARRFCLPVYCFLAPAGLQQRLRQRLQQRQIGRPVGHDAGGIVPITIP
jgi:hypothetical protein